MSKSASAVKASRRPSASQPIRARIRAGWRLVVAGHALGPLVNQGDRPLDQPGGDREQGLHRKIELAAEAPAAGRRHDPDLLGSDVQDARGLVAVHVRRLGRDVDLDAVAGAPGPARLGLDVSVLDEGRGEAALRKPGGLRQGRPGVARAHRALDQQVAGLVRLDQRCLLGRRRVEAGHRRKRAVADRHLLVSDPLERGALAEQGDHGLAPVADDAIRKHRLILEMRIDAEAIDRDVGRGQEAEQTRVSRQQRRAVADGERGRSVRRADHLEPECVRGNRVGAVALAAGELRRPVDLAEPGADRGPGGRIRPRARRSVASSTASTIF